MTTTAPDNPKLDSPGSNRLTPSANYDGSIPGSHDKHAALHCGKHCPFTDIVTSCDDPQCGTEGQICTDGGYICSMCNGKHCTLSGKSVERHCSKSAEFCWVAMTFVGPEGEEDGTEVLDCGSTKPGSCGDNNAIVGEICTNLEDVYGPWYVCNVGRTEACKKPPCWQQIPKGATVRIRRTFHRRRLLHGPAHEGDL